MEFKIDDTLVQEEINKLTVSAIKAAFDTYEVSSAIRKNVAEKVVSQAMVTAINAAIDKINLTEITDALALQLTKSMVSATTLMMKEQTVELIYRLQGRNDYDSDKNTAKEKIRVMLKNARAEVLSC